MCVCVWEWGNIKTYKLTMRIRAFSFPPSTDDGGDGELAEPERRSFFEDSP